MLFSLILTAVLTDILLAYFLFWAMDQVTYGDHDSIQALLFKKNGWVGKVIGGILLVLAPATIAAAILWVVSIAASIFWVVVLWPRIYRLWRWLMA